MSSISSDLTYGLQLDPKTADALTHFARRRRVLLVLRAAAAGIVFFFVTMFVVAICDYLWLLSDSVRWLLSAAGYALTLTSMWVFGLRHFGTADPRLVARQLESADPRLREDLLSAVELADPRSANGSENFRHWLQHRVARRAGVLDISRLLPIGLVQRWLAAGIAILLICALALLIPRMQFGRRIARAMLPGIPIERASLTEITILQPAPPSGYVAEGDAVGVTVRISGAAVDDVLMQWRTEDGIEGESVMSPRVAASTPAGSGTLKHQDTYAANLSVGSNRIEYRITAGDAITLWHRLTPLPRPRVESFKKHYKFPTYAKLADRVEETEHGDLKALVGTMAEVTVRFDEPVHDAMLRFGNRGVPFKIDPVAGSDRDFLVQIPIRTPSNYQVDATSARSGLSNPFSPQYSITPVIDTPPVVRWSASLPKTLIVSPLDVVSLTANAVDDLPMDRVVQEFQINGEAVQQREVPLAQPARELDLRWDWDLLRRIDGEEQSVKLSGGDIIRTRVVAIDRNSQRGESGFIELLIAEEGFDSDRHDRLDVIHQVTSGLTDWALAAKKLMDDIQKVAEEDRIDDLNAAKETVEQLHQDAESLAQDLQRVIESSANLAEASSFELTGRALLDLDRKIGDWFAVAGHVMGDDHPAWTKTREKTLRDFANQSRSLSQAASRIEQYARAIFGEELTVAIVGDAMSLQRSLQPLTGEEPKLPMGRFPRYLTVAIGRLNAIDDLIEKYQAGLPESTQRHLENWRRWPDAWSTRLQASVDQPPQENAHRALVTQFDAELRNQFNHAMVDGRLASTVTNMLREVRNQVGATSDRVRETAGQGAAAEQTRRQAESQDNSDDVARLNRDAQLAQMRFERGRDQLLARLAGEESLHRSRPNVDLQYAADMKLMNRALENVTQEGFAPYREEPPEQVHQNLATAFQIIEAKHEADMWLGELRALMLAERQLQETAIEKIKHPTWIERYATGLEWPVQTLRNARIDWSEIEPIDRTRHGEDLNQARNRITSRRWSGEDMLTAETPLETMQQDLSVALDALVPRVEEARATIRKYVLTLPEQARQAAEKAKEAEQRTESRPDSEAETAAELEEQQQEAEDATRDTLESLVDLANTASLIDPEERELARDADAAAAQIQAALERAETAIENAAEAAKQEQREEALEQTAEALEDLSQALEQTAEHFERAEAGQDLAESREQLRAAEEALRMQEELQQRYDRAEAMAEAAQSSPEELMERLERELQQNEPMQQELSEISERAAEAAQRTLERAAKDEAALNQSLERSDSTFQERKRQAAKEIENLARRAASVDQSLLNAAERSIGLANTPEARPKLNEARQELREAVQKSNQMGGENALLSNMRDTAAEMAKALEEAKQALDEVNQQADQASDQSVHKDAASRKRTKDQVEQYERAARAQQIQAANNEKNQWARSEQDAGRRVAQAQRQKRDAENRKRQVESRIKGDEKLADALKPELEQWQQRIEDAVRSEQAAKETKEISDKQEKKAQQRAAELQKLKIEPIEKTNPAAELAARMAGRAGEELSEIQNDLRQLAEQTEFGDQLRAPPQQAEQFANQQRRIENDVDDATEQLRRAARHEQRLGQEELARQLDAVAEAVTQTAAAAAAKAAESLAQAGENSEQSPEANRRVSEATQQIGAAAEQLAELLASSDPAEAEAAANAESPSQAKAEQLAKTLDELDRAMAQSQQQEGQQGDASQSSQAESPQSADQQAGQAEQPPGQAEPPSAADASPTLAQAMDAQAQAAARQRGEQINPSQGPPQESGPESDQTASSNNTSTQPGGGERPDGGFVDTTGINRLGDQWGQLRQRRTDDAAESRSATIAPQYRREIEAYFRAIAQRAAEQKE